MSLTNGIHLTATERKMRDVLSDGFPHSRQELYACLWDEESAFISIQCHISRMRKKLKNGQTILCELYKRTPHYRLVQLIGKAKIAKGLQIPS